MTRRGSILLVLVGIGIAALFGLATIDRSAVPSWIPRSWAQAMPDRPVLQSWIPASWEQAKAWVGPTRSAAPGTVSSVELKDYEFQLAQPEVKANSGVVVAARLVHKPSGRTVPDAVVFARRIDMAPAGMEMMTAPLEPVPAADPGTYQFRTNLVMEGGWQLSLAAKVQGEIGTVQNRLMLKAVP